MLSSPNPTGPQQTSIKCYVQTVQPWANVFPSLSPVLAISSGALFFPLLVFSSHSLSICVSLIFPLESGSLCFHLPVSPFLSVSLFFFLSQLWNPASSRSVSEFEFLCHVSLSLVISYSLCLYSFLHFCLRCSISPSLFLCVSLSLCLFLCLSPICLPLQSPHLSWAIPVPLPGLAHSLGHKSLNRHFLPFPEIMSVPQ